MSPNVPLPAPELDPPELAEAAGLRYVRDTEAGLRRERAEEGFAYFYPDGRPVRQRAHLRRIEELVIPPAWTDVWICRTADGHLQATGRDTRERKQYLYHERWGEISNLAKFARLHAFGRALPGIRAAVREALEEDEEPTLRRMCAALVALLDCTCARIGNEEYVKANGSFGLSTLRRKHLTLEGKEAALTFVAKGGLERALTVQDRALVQVLREAQDRPGRRLFRYREGRRWRDLEADQVNEFLQEVAGDAFTAKDFRTWKASALAAAYLFARRDDAAKATEEERAAIVRDAVDVAAEALGNTRAVCLTYYIHPAVVETFEEGAFREALNGFRPTRRKWLDRDEQVLLGILEHVER